MAGAGPGPYCATLLADLGAAVLRVAPPPTAGKEVGVERPQELGPDVRNRHALQVDLKAPEGLDTLMKLVDRADAFIDVYRPGVAERLGFGPDRCLERNPRLVFGRLTGWGQDGPMAGAVGHDLNYVGITGVLEALGRNGQPPTPPLHLVGDYAGGALHLALGLVAALFEASRTERGQVVDAAIVDGVASLSGLILGLLEQGAWRLERGANLLDSGAPFYDVYECSDGRYMAFAPIEERFYDNAVAVLGLDPTQLPERDDRDNWPALRATIAQVFERNTREYWAEAFANVDACVTPVLDFAEAQSNENLVARKTFVSSGDMLVPAPAPRFSRTKLDPPREPAVVDDSSRVEALDGWLDANEIETMPLGTQCDERL